MKLRMNVAAAAIAVMPQLVLAGPHAFDVAENLSRFVFSDSPVFEDRMPAYGNFFVTEGYIYPAGTLDGGVEGTLEDGSPAFPEKVIGTWICDGVFVGDCRGRDAYDGGSSPDQPADLPLRRR